MELLSNNSGLEIFKKILDTLPNSIYLKDIHGRYLWLNSASLRQLKAKHLITDSIIKKTDFDIFPATDAAEYAKNDKLVIETRKGVCVEEEVQLPDGRKLTQLSFKEPLYNEDSSGIVGVLGYTIDITEIKKKEDDLCEAKEKAEAANLIKTEFMRNMEHDIRTPFCGVWGIANYLWERETDLQKKEYLGDITLCAKELLDYCNGILDFSKIESGMFPILEKKFILEELVNKIITIELPAAKQKKLQLKINYDANIPRVLSGDNYRLYRVLINLLSNAIKFTEEGAIEVKVSLVKEINKAVLIRFIIEDTGIGIPIEKQEYIFEKFSRLSPSNKGVYKGIGLGLRVVKQFIHEMEGEIDVISKIGNGTQFICTIPFNRPLTDDFVEQ